MDDIRSGLKVMMQRTLDDEAKHQTWTYRAVRPMPVPLSWVERQKVVGDCSKGCQYLCRWTPGCPDPMNNDFANWGNSTTLCSRLIHVDHPSDLEVGDIVTFGRNGDEHAAMVFEAGSDPLLWSFGHQGAPNSVRLSYDKRERQYLKLHLPHRPLTPVEKLQLKTGFWAWLQWRLGEGDWRGLGPVNKFARPDVPKRIPLDWWKRYAQFIANRNKANRATT